MTTRYKITTGPDGVHWVSLEPLLADIKEKLDDPQLPDETYGALAIVQSFIDALVSEGLRQDYSDEVEENTPCQ